MTRKKVKLAFITNDSARKATCKKRKKGLMKKVSELSTLCGIDACAIVYSPYEAQPEVWPNSLGAQRVVAQFKRMPEMEQSKKMVNQESFIRQRIAKANEQLKKQHKDNREKEMTEVMYQCLGGRGLQSLGMGDLTDLGWMLDQNLKEIGKRIESLKKMAPSTQVTEQKPGVDTGVVDGMGMGMNMNMKMGMTNMNTHRPQWLMEWMSNSNDQHMGFGGEEMVMPFGVGDGHNVMWSSAFFP